MNHETPTPHAKKGGAHFRGRRATGLGSYQTRRSTHGVRAVHVVPARSGQVGLNSRVRNRTTQMREHDAKLSQDLCEWVLVAVLVLGVYGIELLVSFLLQASAAGM